MWKMGTRVSYEDRANPKRVGRIVETLESEWGTEYRVVWDDDGEAWSDLRQAGWERVEGDEGQDRKAYSDLQDRDSYTVDGS